MHKAFSAFFASREGLAWRLGRRDGEAKGRRDRHSKPAYSSREKGRKEGRESYRIGTAVFLPLDFAAAAAAPRGVGVVAAFACCGGGASSFGVGVGAVLYRC